MTRATGGQTAVFICSRTKQRRVRQYYGVCELWRGGVCVTPRQPAHEHHVAANNTHAAFHVEASGETGRRLMLGMLD